MVELYFNPNNFDHLILSGVLIQFYKNDIQIQSEPDQDILKFVHGTTIIENNQNAILKFSNQSCKRKIFGKNKREQAVIHMINGVCKDIQGMLIKEEDITDDFKAKIVYLNQYWKQNQWIKNRFIYCHMKILSLSFKIQEKYPSILSKYQIFVELRKLFIQKMMQRQALQAMFAHPNNKYQQFDLFPDMEISSFIQERPRDQIQRAIQIQQNQLEEMQEIDIPVSKITQDTSKFQVLSMHVSQQKMQTVQFEITQQIPSEIQSNINHAQNQHQAFMSQIVQPLIQQQKIEQKIKQMRVVESQIIEAGDRFQIQQKQRHLQSNQKQTNIEEAKHQHESQITQQNHQQSHIPNQNKVLQISQNQEHQEQKIKQTNYTDQQISKIQHQQLKQEIKLSDYDAVQQQVHQTVQQTIYKQQIYSKLEQNTTKDQLQSSQTKNQLQSSQANQMKKSIKDSFSPLLIRNLQFSTKSLAQEQKQIKQKSKPQNQSLKHEENNHSNKQQKISKVNNISQQSAHQNKIQHITTQNIKQATQNEKTKIKLDSSVLIQQAESKQYVEEAVLNQVVQQQKQPVNMNKKKNPQLVEDKKVATQKQNKSMNANKNQSIHSQKQKQKAPHSQTSKSKGPKSEMNNDKRIKPKQQKVSNKNPESCKCSIY